MKALVCELCNGNDFVKEGDFFVCQSCGTKYSAEDAKKMMIEGTVEVQGTVKVDNSDYVEKFLMNARRAKQKEDWEETEKYYNMVEQNDPSNIEAIFYSCYGKAKISLIDSNIYKREAAFNTLQKCISILDDNFSFEKEEENKAIIEQISQDIIGMACSSYVYNQRKNGYGLEVSNDRNLTITLFNNISREFMTTLENIAKKITDENKTKRIFYYELALKHANFVLQNGRLANPQTFKNIVEKYHQILFELDPSYVIPTNTSSTNTNSSRVLGSVLLVFGGLGIVYGILFGIAFSVPGVIGLIGLGLVLFVIGLVIYIPANSKAKKERQQKEQNSNNDNN